MKILTVFGMLLAMVAPHSAAAEASDMVTYSALGRTFSTSKVEVREVKALFDRVRASSPDDASILTDLNARRDKLPPLFIFMAAERTFAKDKAAAVELYWLGFIRARMDAALCSDGSAAQGVAYLPGFARSVASYIRSHPKEAGEIGEKVLKRSDLRASHASPWWICIHGIKATSQAIRSELNKTTTEAERKKAGLPPMEPEAPLAWLRPEADVVPIYGKLLAGAEHTFKELTAPMEEQTPKLTPAVAPQEVVTEKVIGNVLWASRDRLFLVEKFARQPNHLLAWDGRSITTLETDVGFGGICNAGGFVSYRLDLPRGTKPPAYKPGAPKSYQYKIGRPGGNMTGKSFSFRSGLAPGGFQNAHAGGGSYADWGQSSLTCDWIQNPNETRLPMDASLFTDMGGGKGFLEAPSDGTYYHPMNGQDVVKLSAVSYPLRCMKYVPFLQAYQMVACPVRYMDRGRPVNQSLKSVALLRFKDGGATIEEKPLGDIPGENGDTQTLITKAGTLRLMRYRHTPVGEKPGGIYLMRSDGPVKLWEGYPGLGDVSGDGCHIAFSDFTHQTGNWAEREKQRVLVWDVCKAVKAE